MFKGLQNSALQSLYLLASSSYKALSFQSRATLSEVSNHPKRWNIPYKIDKNRYLETLWTTNSRELAFFMKGEELILAQSRYMPNLFVFSTIALNEKI